MIDRNTVAIACELTREGVKYYERTGDLHRRDDGSYDENEVRALQAKRTGRKPRARASELRDLCSQQALRIVQLEKAALEAREGERQAKEAEGEQRARAEAVRRELMNIISQLDDLPDAERARLVKL